MSRKKQSQRDKVLEMLRAGPVTSEQFMDAHVPRYSARILELRVAGYLITSTKQLEHSTFTFRLESEQASAA